MSSNISWTNPTVPCDPFYEICPTKEKVYTTNFFVVNQAVMWLWGFDLLEMITVGFLIYYWYPFQINRNSLSATNCPATAVAPSVWNKSNCLNSHPIIYWTVLSIFTMSLYSAAFVFWILAIASGSNLESSLFQLFLNTTYFIVIGPIGILVLEYLAWQGYGS